MATGDHPVTVFVEIYSADAYRGCHVQHSRNRVDVLVGRFSYLLSLSIPSPIWIFGLFYQKRGFKNLIESIG